MTEQTLLDNSADQLELDQNKDYFKELTGPGGKFYDPDPEVAKQKLARGKIEADTLIPILTRRQDQLLEEHEALKEEYKAVPKLQELIDKLTTQQLTSNTETKVNEVQTKQPAYDPKEVESLIDSRVHEIELRNRETANFNSIQAKLKERYGNNSATELKKQIDDLGLDIATVDTMARKQPKLFEKTFGLNEQVKREQFQNPIQSQKRSDNFAPQGAEKRTWAYYQELKKADPKIYYNPKIAVQMERDAVALGESFKDGDFYS